MHNVLRAQQSSAQDYYFRRSSRGVVGLSSGTLITGTSCNQLLDLAQL
jgi:hypothetical protein